MPITPQQIADSLTAAGLDAPDKFTAFLQSAAKPLQRAAIQQKIDDENAEFAKLTQAHNATLTTLQAALNAI